MESENVGRANEYWESSLANNPSNAEMTELQSTSGTACPYEERFRIDRRKMEQLIIGAHECADSAEAFFNSVMNETNTVISWPYRLKMVAKSRKDPYVRISGTVSCVKKAKELVKSMLDTRMLTPLVFSFELPMKNPVNSPIDRTYPIISMVQERYNVFVTFRKSSKLFYHNVIIKGSELEWAKVEEATGVLLRHLCDIPESEAMVKMTMEITPNHHLPIRGYGSSSNFADRNN